MLSGRDTDEDMGVFKGEWVGDDDAVEVLLFWFFFLKT